MKKSLIILLNLILLLCLAILSGSCEKDSFSGDVVTDSEMKADIYSRSIDTLYFESSRYILEAELYRDFFPGGPVQKERPLVASVYLVNIDSLPVSPNLDVQKLYVINDLLIWYATLDKGVQPNVPDFKLNKLNNNGPEWDTDILVDVVIEIGNTQTNERFLLMVKDINIDANW